MCNVAKHLLIVYPSNRENVQGRLNIKLEFNGKTNEGEFNCDRALMPIADHFKDGLRHKVAQIINWNWGKTLLYNTCQRESCFDKKDGYSPGKPWKENKGSDKPSGIWQL
jgi:hypothetical protein